MADVELSHEVLERYNDGVHAITEANQWTLRQALAAIDVADRDMVLDLMGGACRSADLAAAEYAAQYYRGLSILQTGADFKAKAGAPIVVTRPVVEMPKFDVDEYAKRYPNAVPVQAPVKGQLLWQVDVDDQSTAPVAGTEVKAGQGMGFVQTYYGMEEIIPARDGRVVAVLGKQGENVAKGEIIAFVE